MHAYFAAVVLGPSGPCCFTGWQLHAARSAHGMCKFGTKTTELANHHLVAAPPPCPPSAAVPYLPLNLDIQFPDSVDIHAGISGPLPVPAEAWNNFALTVPDAATLQQLFDAGRRDAAFWVSQQRLAQPEAVAAALRATGVGA